MPIRHPVIPATKSWHGQFRISRGPAGVLPGARIESAGRWQVQLLAGATAVPVHDAAGRSVGVLIGTAIDPAAGAVVTGPFRLNLPDDASKRDSAIEFQLYRLGGSWACVLATDGFERIYLDADGTLSLVYDPEAGAAASTAGLLLDDAAYVSRFRSDLYTALDVDGEGWFPSGLTAHRGISRLLCNHYLDLATFRPVRHWPTKPFTHDSDVDASASRAAEIVRRSAEALLELGAGCRRAHRRQRNPVPARRLQADHQGSDLRNGRRSIDRP